MDSSIGLILKKAVELGLCPDPEAPDAAPIDWHAPVLAHARSMNDRGASFYAVAGYLERAAVIRQVKPFDREKWYNRLLSGEIPQRQNRLGDTSGARCCLGVICDMAVEAGLIQPPAVTADHEDDDLILNYDGSTESVPILVAEWAGLYSVAGKQRYGSGPSMVNMNDTKSYSFGEIVTVVRQNEGLYFKE